MPVLRIIQWLLANGLDVSVLAALLRAQLLTRVVVTIGSSSACIASRSLGGLTGSRVALLLARVPVESTFLELETSINALSLKVDSVGLCAASWIDNLCTTGSGPSSSTAAMDLILRHLGDVWGLESKLGSKQVLTCRGCLDNDVTGDGWKQCESMQVLGWSFSNDGGTAAAWRLTVAAMWRAFWRNVRAPGYRKLWANERVRVINRAVPGVYLYKAQPWPPPEILVKAADRLQRRMVAIGCRNHRYPNEAINVYLRRRAREATTLVAAHGGWWSRMWLKRCLTWDQHLRRDLSAQLAHLNGLVPVAQTPSRWSWAPLLLDFRSQAFLESHRTYEYRGRDRVRV